MNSQKKKMVGSNSFARKPRRSMKAEGTCLNGMLKDGCAKVIDASKLGKRLSSEIWNSFGAIQVQDNFAYPSIDTKLVPEGSSTLRICQFFVACSKCFSVFKYDGHAYGTTGLVKHVKICHGRVQKNDNSNITTINNNSNNNEAPNSNSSNDITGNNFASSNTATIDSGNQITPANNSNNNSTTASVPSGSNTTTTICALNGPTAFRRGANPNRNRSTNNLPSIRYLAKVIEELRSEQAQLKQKINEMINLMNSGYVGQIQIISNEGDKVDEMQQKAD